MNNNFTYISIPKTGSRTIIKVLDSYRNALTNHKPAFRIELIGYSFTFFRDPVERIRSWFYSLSQDNPELFPTYGPDINAWIKKGCPHHWDWSVNPLYQWKFIEHQGKMIIDCAYDFSNMQETLPKLCEEKLGFTVSELPRIGQTMIKERGDLKPSSIKKLREMFPKDFELYEQIKQDGYIRKHTAG